jgi:hypothetical protein
VTYEMKTRVPREGKKGNTTIHISVSVEPINPCATNTPIRTPLFRQLKLWRRKTTISRSTQGKTTRGSISGRINQVSTPPRGSISTFKMAGHDPIIKLP